MSQFLVSIVVSIPACHAGDPGSIPGRGASLFLFASFDAVSYSCLRPAHNKPPTRRARRARARARDSSSKANANTRASSCSASIQYHPMIASDRKLYPRHVDLESTRLALICRSFFCGSRGSGSWVPFRVSCVSLAMRARPVQHNANVLVVPASLFEPQRPFYSSRIVIWTWIGSWPASVSFVVQVLGIVNRKLRLLAVQVTCCARHRCGEEKRWRVERRETRGFV